MMLSESKNSSPPRKFVDINWNNIHIQNGNNRFNGLEGVEFIQASFEKVIQGQWKNVTCPKCNKNLGFWNGNNKREHVHEKCGGVIPN